jgi:hypothetical protein
MTTLYYTCAYLQCARELNYRSPFSELDAEYGNKLNERLREICEALGGVEGIWDSAQDVIGERFTKQEGRVDFEELSRILNTHDGFRYAPFLRPLDWYMSHLDTATAKRIRDSLDRLVAFLDACTTPERRA